MAAAGTVEFWKYWEGRVVDKAFPLLRCLGSGASSAVFLTESAGEKGRRAVLRLVRANSPGAELQLPRWQRAAKLSHPHLIRLLGMGRCQLEDTALLYLVMEYADEDLSQVLPDRPLTAAETTQMLEPAVGALRYLHRQGFVHGRMKPGNIMAVEDRVKLSSDGLWSVNGRTEHRSTPGPYDPPEIATQGMTAAGDVWSLGVTLVEVLTQRPPVWRGGGFQELILPETIPPLLADIARHCLQSDPRSRWTMDQIAERLGHPALEIAAPEVAPKKSPKRFIVLMAIAVVLAIAAMLVFRTPSQSQSEVAAVPVVQSPPQKAQPAAVQPAAVPPEKAKPEKAKPENAKPENAKPEKTQFQTIPSTSADVLHEVMPDVSQHSKDSLRGRFMVNVRVHVDPSGSVTDAKLELRGPSKYFAEHSLEAARQWRFRPTDAAQDWMLHFEFEKSGFKVVPSHVAP